jgi:hypothetical protein
VQFYRRCLAYYFVVAGQCDGNSVAIGHRAQLRMGIAGPMGALPAMARAQVGPDQHEVCLVEFASEWRRRKCLSVPGRKECAIREMITSAGNKDEPVSGSG